MNTQLHLIATILLLSFTSIKAQITQVSVGSSYSQQAYFSLKDQSVSIVDNDSWDIAFSADGLQDAGVFVNESAGLGQNELKVYEANIADWSTPIEDLSVYVDSMVLHNPDKNWLDGAFNSTKDLNDAFDNGWGKYNPQSNSVIGNRIYVIEKRDGRYMKFTIESLKDNTYTFKYAELDGSNEKNVTVSKADAGEASLIYYSFDMGVLTNISSEHDLIFKRYTTPLDAGDGNILEYTVMGVLLSPGVEAVVVDGVDPLLAEESDYSDSYSSLINTIGHEWKAFDFNAGWTVDEDRIQFIKTADGQVYSMIFYDFEGASTGITTLETRPVNTVSVLETAMDAAPLDIKYYPNPSSDFLYIEGLDSEYKFLLYSSSGQLLKEDQIAYDNTVIDLSGLNSGQYYFILSNGRKQIKKAITIIQ